MSKIALLRMLDAFRDKARVLARYEIRRERQACRVIASYDEIPSGWIDWPDANFDPVADDVCYSCGERALNRQRKSGVLLDSHDGIQRDWSGEAEGSRNCAICGRPLSTALLKYGMESEWEHFGGDWFRSGAIKIGISKNEWYWIWRLLDETTGCDSYIEAYSEAAGAVVGWLRDNGFFNVKPGTPCAESVQFEMVPT